MKLTLKAKQPIAQNVTTFTFTSDTPVHWQAGQYLHYELPHENPDNRGTKRWFTISSPPFGKQVTITTRFAGEQSSSFKKALFAMQEGDSLTAEGPEGDFIIEQPEHHYVFIVGGIGITPVRSIVLQLAHQNTSMNIDLMYLNRDENFIFGDELKRLAAQNAGFRLHEFAGIPEITAADIQTVRSTPDTQFYVSGPEGMVNHYKELLRSMSIPESAIKEDGFPGYEVPMGPQRNA